MVSGARVLKLGQRLTTTTTNHLFCQLKTFTRTAYIKIDQAKKLLRIAKRTKRAE